jgi:hypothetical protein
MLLYVKLFVVLFKKFPSNSFKFQDNLGLKLTLQKLKNVKQGEGGIIKVINQVNGVLQMRRDIFLDFSAPPPPLCDIFLF